MHPSPSLTSRQPPPGGMSSGAVSENNINAEVMRIPQVLMNSLKGEMGLGDKDFAALSMAEKVLSLSLFVSRTRTMTRLDILSITTQSIFFFFTFQLLIFDCGHC